MKRNIPQKLFTFLKREGLLGSLKKSAKYMNLIKRRRAYRDMLEITDVKSRFEKIYTENLWGNSASVSGTGSNLEATKNLRSKLPKLISRLNIKTILDVPCGDFYWMQMVLTNVPDVKYHGGDIVSQLVESNLKKYRSESVDFSVIDLRFDPLPDAELIIVRDCLFHLSFDDINSVKENLKRSNIRFILTTTHILDEHFENIDIKTGDFRLIDIFKEPLSFRGPVLESIDDYSGSDIPREMCLLEVIEI